MDVFAQTIRRLLKGHTVGEAVGSLVLRHSTKATWLRSAMEREVLCEEKRDRHQLLELMTTVIDARNWIILGDPAARLPLDGESVVTERPLIEPVPAKLPLI